MLRKKCLLKKKLFGMGCSEQSYKLFHKYGPDHDNNLKKITIEMIKLKIIK